MSKGEEDASNEDVVYELTERLKYVEILVKSCLEMVPPIINILDLQLFL